MVNFDPHNDVGTSMGEIKKILGPFEELNLRGIEVQFLSGTQKFFFVTAL